jgi:hypothetical protein
VRTGKKEKQQVPPLRFASVGMTTLFGLYESKSIIQAISPRKIVIPTEADPNFLHAAPSNDRVCGFL